jgi:Xaa-Pro aminopeptidase
VERLRVIKDEEEVARLRAAAVGLTPVAEAAMAAVRPGAAEKEVAGVIEAALRAAGFERRRSTPSWRPVQCGAAAPSCGRAKIGRR